MLKFRFLTEIYSHRAHLMAWMTGDVSLTFTRIKFRYYDGSYHVMSWQPVSSHCFPYQSLGYFVNFSISFLFCVPCVRC